MIFYIQNKIDMKKLYSIMMMLAMMVAALSFTACGSDDDEVDNGNVEASIVGVWECTYFDFDSDLPGMNADSILILTLPHQT